MDTFATIATVVGVIFALFGVYLAVQIADKSGEWTVLSFSTLLSGIGFGLLIILGAQALHVLAAIEENTCDLADTAVVQKDFVAETGSASEAEAASRRSSLGMASPEFLRWVTYIRENDPELAGEDDSRLYHDFFSKGYRPEIT